MKKYLLALPAASLFFAACSSAPAEPVPDGIPNAFALFAENCASCHASGGAGGDLFDDVWNIKPSPDAILANIRDGDASTGMPPFGDAFSEAELTSLVSYIEAGEAPRDELAETPAIEDVPSVEDQVKIEDWVTDLDEPWGIAFIDDDSALITEKKGTLRVVRRGELMAKPVANIPEVVDRGQGGLLDVAVDPDYSKNGYIYLSFSDPLEPGSKKTMTKIVRGSIDDDLNWGADKTIYRAADEHYTDSRHHFGSRITFDEAGYLYFSIGDRGPKQQAQDLSRPNGKVHRVTKEGGIPDDNPFVDQDGAIPSIWSYGNRNPQGLIIHPDTGVLWETEHGPRGGDELNAIERGVNYGWPEISYGINYNGTELTPYKTKAGMAQPVSQWTPSIAVCGLDVYTGGMFPEWNGRLMAGSLANETVRLIEVDGDKYVSEVRLISDKGRVRDVTTGPDGAIYVALPTKIARITPREK